MEFNLNTAIRSAVILVVGLPVTLGVASSISRLTLSLTLSLLPKHLLWLPA